MIFVGTCGFSYKEWLGAFYPATLRRPEMLQYYAQCFSAVEIDSSYYGVPREETVARMNAKTAKTFRFCFKVPQTVTHPPEYRAVHGDARAFVRSVRDVVAAGKFGCALLQFPNGFHRSEATVAYLRRAVESLGDLPLVAEFRNRQWQTAETIALLSELGVGWCNVDMPRYESLLHASSDVTSAVGYVRFHGRNAAQWWTGDNRTRYDYDYGAEELLPWTDRVAEIDAGATTTFAFFNNHARGHAARNAELFADLLRERFGAAIVSGTDASGRAQTPRLL